MTSPERSLSLALQGGFHVRILENTCCNEQCPASHQCCTPRLLCFNNGHLHVSSEYEEPEHFYICHPGPAGIPSIRRGGDPQIQISPSSIEQASNRAHPEKTIPTWPAAAAPLLASLVLGQVIGKNVLFLKTA